MEFAEVVSVARRRGEEGDDLGVEGLGRVQSHGADAEAGLEQESEIRGVCQRYGTGFN